jgi:adenosylcobyric acid synthase
MLVGETSGPDCERPFSRIGNHTDGAMSSNGLVFGTYVHGLFADDKQRAAWLTRLGATASALNYEAEIDAILDRLAAHMEKHLDLTALLRIAR